jgi:mono/diheme cytochrome c family protein
VPSRSWLLVLPFIPVCSGCGPRPESPDATPAEYPVRTDWMVVNRLSAQPTRWNLPGFPPPQTLEVDPARLNNEQALLLAEVKGRNIVDPRKIAAPDREKIRAGLDKLFGTPEHPKVHPIDNDLSAALKQFAPDRRTPERIAKVNEALADLQLDDATLAEGAKIYRRYCVTCHGLTGDGNGPAGRFHVPPPRDYRQGIFKYSSSSQQMGERKPLRADLARIIRNGLPGSSMPSFGSLPENQMDALVSYVIHLSIRGECEFMVMKLLLADEADIEPELLDSMMTVVKRWDDAQRKGYEPTPDPAPQDGDEDVFLKSAADGYKVFMDPKQGGCTQCHLNWGRNAGYYYDSWGSVVRPRNLTQGLYRGGARGADLYRRVFCGINGSGMPNFDVLAPTAEEKERGADKIWDLVHFLQVLPNKPMRTKLEQKYGVSLDI